MTGMGKVCILMAVTIAVPAASGQQTAGQAGTYQVTSPGDKALSQSEAGALAYMRTVVAAQRAYKRKHGHYAESLQALVGSLSFTRRMTNPNRGDYKVGFQGGREKYFLTLTPIQFDTSHRAFYVDETGRFRVEESKTATAKSAPLK
ncbi:MAG: hypothetical protein ACE14M_04055 [Terriglobales bacterium]